MSSFGYPYRAPALRIEQRIGVFYAVVLPAELLLQVAASDRMQAIVNPEGGYSLLGTQRPMQDKRLTEISEYINRHDSTFPNSIILAANYNFETGFDQDETEDIEIEGNTTTLSQPSTWRIIKDNSGCLFLEIPSPKKMASLIDGQHRLFAFTKADLNAMEQMNLLCSVFLDLPKPLQAQIFAVINSTQKGVDKSLTYELFGYNVNDEEEVYWTPDKLAVYLTRKLGTDQASPLQGRITVAPKRDSKLEELNRNADWRVSTAAVVDGILRLITTQPKRDSNFLKADQGQVRAALSNVFRDSSPLRSEYISGNDALIYRLVLNYLQACQNVFWRKAANDSFIIRTVGVQALFDILRKLVRGSIADKNISVRYFEDRIEAASSIDFAEESFKKASGSGRTIIRRAIENAVGLI